MIQDINIRPAHPGDEEAAAVVLCTSITELCLPDHRGDPSIISRWLANKTPANVRSWMETPGYIIVAEERGAIVGIAAAISSGEITLNYIAPAVRFHGVSKALLHTLEDRLRTEGHVRSSLSSTYTAYRFYRSTGYVDAGEPCDWCGLKTFPMMKNL